jgi:RNA polymerase sigma factor (sigma-70 family)
MRPRQLHQLNRLSDVELLEATTGSEPDAFAIFYRRYRRPVMGLFLRRTRDPELSADLMGETFAAALVSLAQGVEPVRSPASWLLQIAHNKLIDSVRRGRVEETARAQLHFEPIALDDDDLLRIQQLTDTGEDLLNAARRELPSEQWEALRARVIDERDYPDIARSLSCSELVVRKRVSRALQRLRLTLREAP